MRTTVHKLLRKGRVRTGRMASDDSFGLTGVFRLSPPVGLYAGADGAPRAELTVIATDPASTPPAFADSRGLTDREMAWEHVSVSVRHLARTPTWEEMAWVKRLFWRADELVVEFHPPERAYVNNTEALHLWRDTRAGVELPPPSLIGLVSPCRLGRYTPADASALPVPRVVRQLAEAGGEA